MLHTIAAGTRDVSQQQTPYVAQAREAGFIYEPAHMSGLDRTRREILIAPFHADDGREIIPARRVLYDTLVLATGSQANFFGTPGAEHHCWRLDSVHEASAFNVEVRLRMLQCLVRDEPLPIAIVGGGATGVELAAELVLLTETAKAYGANGLAERLTVTLIESGPRLLAGFSVDVAEAVAQRLASIGVRVCTSARVAAVETSRLVIDGGAVIPAGLTVWAAGIEGARFADGLDGLQTNGKGQVLVDRYLQTSDPHIFALGDGASFTPMGAERPLPPTAQVARQQARYLARRLSSGTDRKPNGHGFEYSDRGSLVTLAHYDGYGALGKLGPLPGLTIRGATARIGHGLLYRAHQSRLHGFWRGGLMWLVDELNTSIRPPIRMD
jgi:NADH:ubiquinone reductase (H+-translocating)